VPTLRPFAVSIAALALITTFGCRAQSPAQAGAPVIGKPLPESLARRVEVVLRQKANLPPGSTVNIGPATPSDVPGFDSVSVSFVNDGSVSRPISFLISSDGRTLAQFNKFDISADPRNLVSADGRPARGGPDSAPVLIVGFDDLECPFCARLHESIFPAITKRYGDKVHIVYKDFPLDQHPWAMRAAVDVNCLGEQSSTGYWDLVDYIHAHASDIGTDPKDAKADKTLPRANDQLDKLTRDQATTQKADMPKLNACLAKQDTAAINTSRKLGEKLGVDSTPVLFINGDKVDGAVPLDFIFNVIDGALRAEGVQPPPPYVAPAPPAGAKPTAESHPPASSPSR
jgi:protein-disulfide isomerase